jgi:putative DNA primase/helicase
MSEINLQAAKKLASYGLAVFPAGPDKKPLCKWRETSTSDTAQVEALWREHPDGVPAIDCAKSNLLVVDLDRHEVGKDGVTAFAALEARHGRIDDAPRILTPNKGCHVFFSQPAGEALGNSSGLMPAGIDVRGAGGYVIAPGAVMPDGRRYEPDGMFPRLSEKLSNGGLPKPPRWVVDLIRPREEEKVASPAEPRHVSVEDDEQEYVEAALSHLNADDRDLWLRVGGALHDSDQPWARQAWDDWSAASSKYNRRDQEDTWSSFRRQTGRKATIGTIIHEARQAGFTGRKHKAAAYQVADEQPAGRVDSKKKRVTLTSAMDVEPEDIEFLMEGYLAKGKLHVLAGPPGVGKTTLATKLCASVSAGALFPTGDRPKIGNVVIWSGEDGIADTILPRFLASDGDRGRLWVINGTDDVKGARPFDPATDMAELRHAIEEIGGCDLLIVDPIVSAVAGDGHKNNEVRRSLQPLVDLAAATGAAVIGISHLTKGTSGRDPVERVSGSLAYGALARVVLFATKEKPPEDGSTPRCIFMRAKSNIGPDTGGFMYSLVQTQTPGYDDIIASVVRFEEPIEGTAREILAQAEEMPDAEEGSAIDEAKDFLRDMLKDGSRAFKDIRAAAAAAGVMERTLRRAKHDLGVKSVKSVEAHGPWLWCLAEDGQGYKEARHSQSKNSWPSWPSYEETTACKNGVGNLQIKGGQGNHDFVVGDAWTSSTAEDGGADI